MACAIHDACKARFFAGEATHETQFARDLLEHLDLLHTEGRLTATFLELAFDRLGQTTALDTHLMDLVDKAVACLAASEANEG